MSDPISRRKARDVIELLRRRAGGAVRNTA